MFRRAKLKWCLEIRMNAKLSLNCSGTERQEGGGDNAKRLGGGGGEHGKDGVCGWMGGGGCRKGGCICL